MMFLEKSDVSFKPPQSHIYVNLGRQLSDKKIIKEEHYWGFQAVTIL